MVPGDIKNIIFKRLVDVLLITVRLAFNTLGLGFVRCQVLVALVTIIAIIFSPVS
jgi:hypothetical protein